MVVVRLRYVVARRGRLFWQPTAEMQAMGFLPKPLGPDGPESRAEATRLYEAWIKERDNPAPLSKYPEGSFGYFYDHYRTSRAWAKKKTRTREDYQRAWVHINSFKTDDGLLSKLLLTKISTDHCEAFFDHLTATVSRSERYRAIKCTKVLLADAMVRLRLGVASPADNLVNPQAKGRSQIWLGAEVEILAKTATDNKYHGMATAIRAAWDSLFSPVDVRTLRRSQMRQDGDGWFLAIERAKTGKDAYAAISEHTAGLLLAEIAKLPSDPAFDVQIIRQPNGNPYPTKDTFGDHFREVRKLAFGPDEKRQFMDIRRSGNVEADAAGADKATMGELLANGLADNKFLDETYTPPTVAKAREVAVQRLEGRRKLAGEIIRQRSKSL